MASRNPCVAIFRRRLLPASETFIANQARFLQEWSPLLLGYAFDKRGSHLVQGFESSCLSDHNAWPWLSELVLKKFSKMPHKWILDIMKHQPKLLHAHFGWSAAPGMAIADALGIPMLTTFHGSDITKNTPRPSYLRQREKLFKRNSPFLAVSEFVKSTLIVKGCHEESIRVHYIGVDTELFCPGSVEEKSHTPTIVFVGHLNEQKGCSDLITAVIKLSKNYPDWNLQIIGDGPLRKALEKQAAPLRERCQFSGVLPPSEVRKALQNAEISCVPSRQLSNGREEALSMACVEASSSGLPVVAYNTGGISEVIIHGTTGLLAEKNNHQDLAHCLEQLMSSKDQCLEFGRQGRKLIQEKFDIRQQSTELERIYFSLVN